MSPARPVNRRSSIGHRFDVSRALKDRRSGCASTPQVDQALRPFLNGLEVPLILAATEPIDSIYRSVSTYPHPLAQSISGNPETVSDAEPAANPRVVLDD